MTLAERVKKSEVFAGLSREDRKAILQAIKARRADVVTEVTAILDRELSINDSFERSIEELTNKTVMTMKKQLERLEKKRLTAEKEAAARIQDEAGAEQELKELMIVDLTSNKTNNSNYNV